MKTFIAPFLLVLFLFTPVSAKVTYSSKDLKNMIGQGEYPEVGMPMVIRDEKLIFSQCMVKVKAILFTLQDTYPMETKEETKENYIVDVWLNDGLTKAYCSKADEQLKMTSSPYEE